MTETGLMRGGGAALVLAGALHVPLLLNGWRGMEDIGSSIWTLAYASAAGHHVMLLFGLFALFGYQLRSAPRIGPPAFVGASLGNAVVGGIGFVQLSILPALKSNPAAEASLICLPFYRPATRSAAGFIEQACRDWDFDVLTNLTVGGWAMFGIGSFAIGLTLLLTKPLPRAIGGLLIVGWLALTAGSLLPLPLWILDSSYAAIAIAYIGAGTLIMRNPGGRPA
jgi:hypothetical protein